MRRCLTCAVLALTLAAVSVFSQAPPQNQSAQSASQNPAPPYLDPKLPVDQRVNDLVARMTLEEKAAQMQDAAPALPRLNVPAYNWWNEALHGVARAGNATVFPQAIGLAATWDTNLIHTVADVISTEARAKFNDAQAHSKTDRYYGLTFWSPNINIFRDPRWGRGQETYGEDPFLTGRIAVAFVTGLQGDDAKYLKTISTPKHFAVHSGPEVLRHRFDVPVSPHDFADTYSPAFRAAIVEGKADSVMCSYNAVRGIPACASPFLLTDTLRNAWGFKGYVVSDCGAVTDINHDHYYVNTIQQAAALAVKAGDDLSCGSEYRNVADAVRDRLLSMDDVNRAVKRLFEARFRLGMFDPPDMVPWSKLTIADNDTPAHRMLALQTARESIVLLKNDHSVLPLASSVKNIAVVGPTADLQSVLLGNYNGTPSSSVTLVEGIRKRFANANVTYVAGSTLTETSPVEIPWLALQAAGGADGGITNPWRHDLQPTVTGDYLIGCTGSTRYKLSVDGKVVLSVAASRNSQTHLVSVHLVAGHKYRLEREGESDRNGKFAWVPPAPDPDAVAAAKNADVVIAVVGITPELEGEEMSTSAPGFFGGDRVDLELPKPQQELLEAVAATHKPLIVVLTSGSALAVNWAQDHAAAVLETWYSGEEGGTALADVLSGDYNPAGRLPVTFYSSIAQLPPFDDYTMQGRTYRYFFGAPLYPFGYGLSYTNFSYSNPRVDRAQIAATDSVTISADVKNTGAAAGDEVVELYLTHPGVEGAPIRSLNGFQRIHLNAGEQKTVSFTLRDRELSVVDEAGKTQILTGPVEVWIGGGQPVAPRGGAIPPGMKTQFQITSAATLPD